MLPKTTLGAGFLAAAILLLAVAPVKAQGTSALTIDWIEGRTDRAAGNEYVAFLKWDPQAEEFRPLEDDLVIPVRDGRIEWPDNYWPEFRNDEPLQEVLATVRLAISSR